MNRNRQYSPLRIGLDVWMARIGRVIAWAGLILWTILAIAGFSMLFREKNHENPADYYMPYVSVGLAALNGWALLSIRRRRGLLSDFGRYCAIFAREPEKSIPDLAAMAGVSEETALRQLEKMCERRYFNGYIDYKRQCIVFTGSQADAAPDVVYCPGCGARNAVTRTGDVCRYCGVPLKKQ